MARQLDSGKWVSTRYEDGSHKIRFFDTEEQALEWENV